MVFQTVVLLLAKEFKVPRQHLKNLFVDSLRLYVKGGAGGNGFPKYGGIGGKGGDVYLIAKEGITLKDVLKAYPSKRISAGLGGNSLRNKLLGEYGGDTEVTVPVGITVIDEHGRQLGELNEESSKLIIARGGAGGAPHSQYFGSKGQSHSVLLELKIIADVGLVGFPNAGKSSLLKAISQAKPRIASYPFTTLRPQLGIVQYPDFRQISIADLPGLIEGAHVNIGLGHRFLRHVERTNLLLLVVDIEGFRLGPEYPTRSCIDTVLLLNKELELYRESLISKPSILLVNKMDKEGANSMFEKIKPKLHNLEDALMDIPEALRPNSLLKFDDILSISALHDQNSVEKVKKRIREVIDYYAGLANADKEFELLESIRTRSKESARKML